MSDSTIDSHAAAERPVMGVFELTVGQISARWDYFDMAAF